MRSFASADFKQSKSKAMNEKYIILEDRERPEHLVSDKVERLSKLTENKDRSYRLTEAGKTSLSRDKSRAKRQ